MRDRKSFAVTFSGLILLGCSNSQPHTLPIHPFTGCWENEDGSAREVWAQDPSGWLFGYAANREADGSVSFFEQMRIEPRETGDVLIVIGPKGDSVEFQREDTGTANDYKYVNPDHDYPQVITYYPSKGRLDAFISLSNGEERIEFKKRACE